MVQLLVNLAQEMLEAHDKMKNTYSLKLQHYFINELVFLCPSLIPSRFKLVGAMMDQTASTEIKYNEFTRQLQLTFIQKLQSRTLYGSIIIACLGYLSTISIDFISLYMS